VPTLGAGERGGRSSVGSMKRAADASPGPAGATPASPCHDSRQPLQRAPAASRPQAAGPRPRATSRAEQRLLLPGQRAGRQRSKERALTYPLCLDDSAEGSLPEAQRKSPVKRAGNLAGNSTGGREISCPLSLSLWLLHRGAGQLSAPNLYQLSKYSVVLTGCWIAWGKNSVPHRRQLVKHLTPSLLVAGSSDISQLQKEPREEPRAGEARPPPAGSHQATGIPPGAT